MDSTGSTGAGVVDPGAAGPPGTGSDVVPCDGLTDGAGARRAHDPLIGTLLDGRYRIDAVIAQGGMATVYTATDSRLDRTVAVKVMRPLLAQDPDFVERFAREARAAARLSSPEVVAVHDQGTDVATGTAYLVMEHISGKTLRDLIEERGPLPAGRALELLEPVLRALAAAHAAGLVHRDVKPENVLLGDDGRVKVTDFGLARAIETSNLTATTGFLMGTMAYLAPEQVEQGRSDTRTDVYAAGILLWELLTGGPPYRSDSPMTVAYRHVNEDVPPPGSVVSGIPRALDELVVTATRRDPAARPVDAGAFLEGLRAVRATTSLPSSGSAVLHRQPTSPTLVVPLADVRPDPVGPPPRRRRRRLLVPLVVLLVLALAGAAAGGWYYLDVARYTASPVLVGLAQPAAEQAARTAGLEPVVSAEQAFSETMPAGAVLRQDPDARTEVRKGSTVELVLSKGPDRRTVPELVDKTREQATAALGSLGLRAGPVTERFDAKPAGTVLAVDPAPGAALPPGTAVALVVSKGLEMLPVPDVRGKERKAAQKALSDAGFQSGVTEAFSEEVPAGVVLEQKPATGTAPRGAGISLVVSKGPDLVTVPDVSGRPRAEAEATLTGLGLKVRVVAIPGPGTVRSTDPPAGAKVRRGTTVNLYVF